MINYEEQVKMANDAIDALVDLFKGDISHLEILREYINVMNEEQFKTFVAPFATGILPEIAERGMKADISVVAAIETVKCIKEGNE